MRHRYTTGHSSAITVSTCTCLRCLRVRKEHGARHDTMRPFAPIEVVARHPDGFTRGGGQ